MKILALSDLHGKCSSLDKILSASGEADLILFAGDITDLGFIGSAKVLERLWGKKVLAVQGNCDLPWDKAFFDFSRAIDLHASSIEINDVLFMGLAGSNITPYNTPYELTECEIEQVLDKFKAIIKGYSKRKILLSHVPPFEILDFTKDHINAGSYALRDFIESNELDLVICGHIHEAYGIDRLGKTLIVNTGAAEAGHAAVIEIDVGIEVQLLRVR
jgi:Icc-related predicted phosphoesterase